MAHPKDGRYRKINDALSAYNLGKLQDVSSASGQTIPNGIFVWLPRIHESNPPYINIVYKNYVIERNSRLFEPGFDVNHTTITRENKTFAGYNYENLGEYKTVFMDYTKHIIIHEKINGASSSGTMWGNDKSVLWCDCFAKTESEALIKAEELLRRVTPE